MHTPQASAPACVDENATPNREAGTPPDARKMASDIAPPASSSIFTEDLVFKIMENCGWKDRIGVMMVTQPQMLRKDQTWETMCHWLGEEFSLYVPVVLCERDWRTLFLSLYASRHVFQEQKKTETVTQELLQGADSDEQQPEDAAPTARVHHFNIMVCARMKPLPPQVVKPNPMSDGSSRVMDVGVSVILPLHQRLQLIRDAHKCSAAKARRILWQGADSADDPSSEKPDPWADAAVKALDLRPPPGEVLAEEQPQAASPEKGKAGEDDELQACVVNVTKGRDGSVLMCCPGTGLREFAFDAVLGEQSSQADVYNSAPRRLVTDFLNGRNACIFAYGQTGSGKTHTMFGPDLASSSAVGNLDEARSGIVPRACSEVMAALEQRTTRGFAANLSVSYVEIYGEQVTDLLMEGAQVGLWHGVAHHAVYTGNCAQKVETVDQLRALLLKGDEAKRRAATAMNERSSRAHALLLFSLAQVHAETGVEVCSSLCLADLGGSEKVLKSQVATMTEQAGGYHQADVRLKEAMNINLGLLAIKLCIKALNEDTVGYVPYQNSRLTMMLSAALGGECRTAVMVTGSGERKHAVETMHALRFGEDCSRVTTTSREDSMAAARRAIRALDAEIAEVEAAIVAKERWETRRVERVDERHQEDDPLPGTEMVSASALVGAESERDHLEVLLARRKILAGV